MSIVVRRAESRDLDAIWEIEKKCFTDEAFTKEQIAYLLEAPSGISLVAQIDHEIAGFIIGLIHQSDKTRTCHIYTIDVLTKHRRKGVASRLLSELEGALIKSGVTACYLEARANNVAAQKLYQKHGYTKAAQLKDYYGRGTHGIRFKKDLF